MTLTELARDIALSMMGKGGVREWDNPDFRTKVVEAAREMAQGLYFWETWMATEKILTPEMDGTPKQIALLSASYSPTAANDLRFSSPTTATITLASLANYTSETTGARQSAKFDFGAVRARAYKVRAAFELAATPTAGAEIEIWYVPSSSSTAGTGNVAGASGTDAAYTGYSSNNSASLKQAVLVGSFICTAQATATVQIAEVGILVPTERYASIVVFNKSGAAFHSDDQEALIVLDPIFDQIQAAV